MSQVTLGGNPIEVAGTFPSAGQKAPAFSLVGKDLKPVSLADFAGKRKVLNIVPSLDTPTCATSTRKFNEAADVTSGPLTGLTARAVVVIDENDNVVHAELVSEIKNEPNYDAALGALK